MAKLKINGLIEDSKISWKKIKCCCSTIKDDIENQFPIFNGCIHCKSKAQQDSMPRVTFSVKQNEIDKDGNITDKIIVKEVKEITIVRGEKYQDIVAWSWSS